MSSQSAATLKEAFKGVQIEVVYATHDWENIELTMKDVNRPGLALAGYFEYFQPKRLQICGMAEIFYLRSLDAKARRKCLDDLFATQFPAMVVTTGLDICDEMLDAGRKYKIPIFRTENATSPFMADMISILSLLLAPMLALHGVLVEVYGEGVLILGDSGVGKSETAMELVKRGHRLIADDSVEIRRVSNRSLVGTSPEMIRHYIELRGIGIIDVRSMYGAGSVRLSKEIDLVINLETWDETKQYERAGDELETYTVLDIELPMHTIPVKPGRNLAVILEVAARNYRLKFMGYDAISELDERRKTTDPDGGPFDF